MLVQYVHVELTFYYIHVHDGADFLATYADDGPKTGSPGKAGCGLP